MSQPQGDPSDPLAKQYPQEPYQQPSNQPAPYQPSPYQQPYQQGYPVVPAVDPMTGAPLSDKSKIVAGILGIALGWAGAGRFYTGHTGMAIAQIAVTWLTCGFGGLWPLIDGIMILINGGTDAQGRRLRDS
jgi:TM2 domain-containing membrane protein YozV